MADDENLPLESVDIQWLETHLAELRREIESRPGAELRRAAKLALAAGDDALDEGDLRRAALQYQVAVFLVTAAKKGAEPSS